MANIIIFDRRARHDERIDSFNVDLGIFHSGLLREEGNKMILSKDTRHLLKIGTRLKNGNTIYLITNMWEGKHRGSLYITIQNTQAGWKLYGEPSNHLYGMEIIESD